MPRTPGAHDLLGDIEAERAHFSASLAAVFTS
jgi:hypothetical protein